MLHGAGRLNRSGRGGAARFGGLVRCYGQHQSGEFCDLGAFEFDAQFEVPGESGGSEVRRPEVGMVVVGDDDLGV